ncbi:MAG TPA: hypothetical protein VNS50_10230 [Ginsengibacter sp.]|nr:hypothetical protein [Ginsengibacter sp.]
MKTQIFQVYVFAVISLMFSCKHPPTPADVNEPCIIQTDNDAIASKLLTLSDAEKIMGESAELTCNTFTKKDDTLEYKCDYTELSQDIVTGKTGKLYFMHEVYASIAAAENAYTSIYEANRRHEGVEVVTDLGDEAYYQSDGKNFYFFLVRKGEKMFRMKLNKVTSYSSEAAFKDVAREVADKI